MFEKKRLLLNSDICDARKIKEEDYQGYEEIILNADILLINEKSKSIINRLPLIANVDETVEIPENVEVNLQTINGNYEINKATGVAECTVLCLNGSLLIQPDTEEILKNYYKILVNGSVKYPESMEGRLPDISVNGEITSYPDNCIILEPRFVIDKYFPLRAKENGHYYVENEVILADETVDIAMLIDKKVQFVTKCFLVPESRVREGISLFDETVKLLVIPEGMKAVCSDALLDSMLLQKYGDKIFVYGDLTVTEESLQSMEKLKELVVEGDIFIKKKCIEAFEQLHAQYRELKLLRKEMKNKMRVTVDTRVLTASPDGICVKNVAELEIKKEVAPQTIVDLLAVENCKTIYCTSEQKSCVELISSNVAFIKTEADEAEEESVGGIFSQIKQGIGFLKDTKMVNADKYIM